MRGVSARADSRASLIARIIPFQTARAFVDFALLGIRFFALHGQCFSLFATPPRFGFLFGFSVVSIVADDLRIIAGGSVQSGRNRERVPKSGDLKGLSSPLRYSAW
jgi:hypothetical protein